MRSGEMGIRPFFWLALSWLLWAPTTLFTALAILSADAMDYFEQRSRSTRGK